MKNIAIATFGLTGTLSLIIASLGSVSAWAADSSANQVNWPQWRGPSGNGLVQQGNPPLEWSETSNVKWKVKIPGICRCQSVLGSFLRIVW